MKNMINVGNEVSDLSIKETAEAISAILRVGAEVHTEQETIRYAIKALGELAPVKNVNISGCYFSSGVEPSKVPAGAAHFENTERVGLEDDPDDED